MPLYLKVNTEIDKILKKFSFGYHKANYLIARLVILKKGFSAFFNIHRNAQRVWTIYIKGEQSSETFPQEFEGALDNIGDILALISILFN